MNYNIDKLFDAAAKKGVVCVGLDTLSAHLPESCRVFTPENEAAVILTYNKALIDATIDVCACYKVQIACYEALGINGLASYSATLRYARERGALVIADVKRGDIADTAKLYAKAHFSGDFEADFVTLSPYMGMDTLDNWLQYAKDAEKGAFVLLRTSNSGARDFQWPELIGGGRLYNLVGDKLSLLAEKYMGRRGYGAFGAVVGCTDRREAADIRARYNNLFFLIPGYGAQGGGAEDAALLLKNGNGGIVNASRSILTAWKKTPAPANGHTLISASEAARAAVIEMRDMLAAASGGGGEWCKHK